MYIVYILQSIKTKRYYIGQCKNIAVRLTIHNAGKVRSTKNNIPWKVVHLEKYITRSEAYKRERQIKSYKGGNAFKELLSVTAANRFQLPR